MSLVSVNLKPTPGFTVKSTTLTQGFYNPRSSATNAIAIPKGLKIFVNIAWDPNVPPPPEGSEDVIQKAMLGEDLDDLNPDGWYVPTVISDGRQDTDKAGKQSLVFDAVFNSSLKSRTLKDPEFKLFLIELAFQRIEAQTSSAILLSRQIGTPNIASKGMLEPRTVQIPTVLYPEGHPNRKLVQSGENMEKRKKLMIEEVAEEEASTKVQPVIPSWTWSKPSTKIEIVINVPNLTHAHIPTSTLDLEPHRIILSIPNLYALDINLDASDAELVATFSEAESEDGGWHKEGSGKRMSPGENALTLKRMRDLVVGDASAEWRVEEKVIVVYA